MNTANRPSMTPTQAQEVRVSLPTRQRVSSYAIETNGVGQASDYHINRTVTINLDPKHRGNDTGYYGKGNWKWAEPVPDRIPYAGSEK